jgi:6-pyruvoyltetrahydropterin/6-carboxytetrahydropterin synthase
MKAEVSAQAAFDYAHRLMRHKGQCYNLHGHRGLAVLSATMEVEDATGMALDFTILKQHLRLAVIDLDHATLVEQTDSLLLQYLQSENLRHEVFDSAPTAEKIADFILSQLCWNLGAENRLLALRVTVFESPETSVTVTADRDEIHERMFAKKG